MVFCAQQIKMIPVPQFATTISIRLAWKSSRSLG